ncbi:hypothetical protein Ahy_A07g033435 isoform A [Arachis hypogaea]|uniref:Uncharacterized protein n=1 Tax=Arachis hypogaea TaxID=3818 RepID=A0A445C985_ARAHY|nr:hypothetical protein Ahy_A07g033435 isoform A [Arachis hypogaea]
MIWYRVRLNPLGCAFLLGSWALALGQEKFVKRRRKQTGGEGSKTIYLTRNVTEIPIGFDYLGLKLKGFPVLRHIPSLMSSNSYRGGSAYGDAAPFRSREGLSTRPAASSDEIQLRIDPMDMDLDHEITGLRGQVKKLRNDLKLRRENYSGEELKNYYVDLV